MSATLSAPRAAEFDLASDHSAAARQRRAMSDVVEAAALWRLIRTLGWLDIKLRYRGSVLGPFWLTISTATMVASLGIVYSTLFHQDMHTYLPFLTVSLVIWGFISGAVTDACTCFLQAEGTIRSMRMPFTVHAARVVVRNVLMLAHNALVIIGVFIFYTIWPGASGLAAIPGFALWIVDAFAVCLLLGCFCARFRDIPPIVTSVLQIVFFVSPIVWQPSQLGKHAGWLIYNPFFSLLEIVRAPLLGHIPGPVIWLAAIGFSALLWLMSWALFVRVRGRIAFWI
jgi:lipopolysaccharide transport system permease protein